MNLIPRDRSFFELLNRQAEGAIKASELLKEFVEVYQDLETYGERIGEIEHEADIATHEIMDRLNRSFITPLDQEDIHALAHNLDDVVDFIEAAVGRTLLYKIERPTEEMKAQTNIILKATRELSKAVDNLSNMKHPRRILDYCIEINRLENEGDRILREALQRLFNETTDAILLLKWKEIYESLEFVIDKCEDIANIIEGIVVKNV